MNESLLNKKIRLLKILVENCRKHPAYRARRKATEKVRECVIVWKARIELENIIQ